jgi:hypothetical protein
MDQGWQSEFRGRMKAFEATRAPHKGEVSVSLKVRVVSGCFHREHSPHAYSLIDKQLASRVVRQSQYTFIEHESGPELLVYVAAGITLAGSIIALITAIINARSVGIRKGDRPSDPLEVIVRRVGDGDNFVEETVLRVGHTDSIRRSEIEARLEDAIRHLVEFKGANTASHVARKPQPKRR